MNQENPYDLIVIGGGINGVGIAADAAGRGLAVYLCEQHDLASGTSSMSTKLIHGGLRYLESYNFALVRKSLKERKILHTLAPHLIKPLRFVMPYTKNLRSLWLIRLGLYVYDFLGPRFAFKRSKAITLETTPDNPLKRSLRKGFIYTDCFTDDARLVIANALRAKRFGAQIQTRVKCIGAFRSQDLWEVHLLDTQTNQTTIAKSYALVNAAGPWVETVIQQTFKLQSKNHIKLVKGSHLVVPKLYEREQAYTLQHKDGRIVFVIPYLNQFTLIGTTDVEHKDNPELAQISIQEKEYLCNIVSDYFHHPLKPHDILYAWSGVRPLVDDHSLNASSITRDYKLELQVDANNKLPLIHVFGGKLTTYRVLAEQAVDMLAPFFTYCGTGWTSTGALPGGNLPENNLDTFIQKLAQDYAWLPHSIITRFAHSYGTLSYHLLKEANSIADLGKDFGQGLYEKEVIYLIEHEWAKSSEDILMRRTKIGYFLNQEEKEELNIWLMQYWEHTQPPLKRQRDLPGDRIQACYK